MQFTDRNRILLKLGILAVIALYAFGPSVEQPDHATMCSAIVTPSAACGDTLAGLN